MASDLRQERIADLVYPMVAAKVAEILRPSTIYLLIALNFALLFCFTGIGLWAWGKFNHNADLLKSAEIHRGVLDKQVGKLQVEMSLMGELSEINNSLDEIADAVGVKGDE